MPSIYQLKPRFQALLRPLVHRLHDAGITANQVTLAACAGSLAIAGLVALFAEQRGLFALIPLWMTLRMALNAIDGMLDDYNDDIPSTRGRRNGSSDGCAVGAQHAGSGVAWLLAGLVAFALRRRRER